MKLGSPHRHFAECESTSDIARAWAMDLDSPAPNGALVTADYQTQGRGRRGRDWEASPGESLLASVVLRPPFPQADAWRLAFLSSLAVADVLQTLGLSPALKWPNDVLLEGRKVAGLLIETAAHSPLDWAAIVGVGINVNQSQFANEASFLMPPISLRLATGTEQSVPDLQSRLLVTLAKRLTQYETYGWAAVLDDWRARMARGVALGRGAEPATLEDVLSDGSARVRLAGGTLARWVTVEAEEGAIGPANPV